LKRPTRVTALVFDLSEVLLRGYLGTQHLLQPLLRRDPEQIHQEFKVAALKDFFEGRITEEAYFAAAIRDNNWTVTVGQCMALVRRNFAELPGTRRVITAARKRGYRTGLISDHAREWVEHLEDRFRFRQLFDAVVFSCAVGLRKPDPRIFYHALNRLGATPSETVFIDDHYRNCIGAEFVGMRTVHFRNATQLARDLRHLGVDVLPEG
jgi:epoxide hydrolase-like predicted phosphatase